MSESIIITLTCKHCGRSFDRLGGVTGRRPAFCGNECKRLEQQKAYRLKAGPRKPLVKNTDRKCVECGNVFRSNVSKKMLCSKVCVGAYLGKKSSERQHEAGIKIRTKKCNWCGRLFVKKKGGNKGLFCSREHAYAYLKEHGRTVGDKRPLKNRLAVPVADGQLKWLLSWVQKRCKYCGDQFYTTYKSRIYCGSKCSSLADLDNNNPPLNCKTCGTAIARTTGQGRGIKVNCLSCYPIVRKKQEAKAKRISRAKRRARMNGIKRESIDPHEVFDLAEWMCNQCGVRVTKTVPVDDDRYPHLDHIIPLSKGGTHTWDNVQCLCRRCNLDKSDMMPNAPRTRSQCLPLFDNVPIRHVLKMSASRGF